MILPTASREITDGGAGGAPGKGPEGSEGVDTFMDAGRGAAGSRVTSSQTEKEGLPAKVIVPSSLTLAMHFPSTSASTSDTQNWTSGTSSQIRSASSCSAIWRAVSVMALFGLVRGWMSICHSQLSLKWPLATKCQQLRRCWRNSDPPRGHRRLP